jgi:serine/threonine-protein kinase SRPK3
LVPGFKTALSSFADSEYIDLSISNVAFAAGNLPKLDQKQLINDVIGTPRREPLSRVDGHPLEANEPRELTETAAWDGWVDEDEAPIRLIDFGESFFGEIDSRKISQPLDQKVPESIFEKRLDYKADLWRAGIIVRNHCSRSSFVLGGANYLPSTSHQIYSLVFNKRPFFAVDGDHDLVFEMVDFVDKLPPHWHQQWVQMRKAAGEEANSRPSKFSCLYASRESRHS